MRFPERNGITSVRAACATIATGCLLLASAETSRALQPPQAPQEAPSGQLSDTTVDLKAEAVQTRIAQIEAATDLPESVKTELLSLYRQTLHQITATTSWMEKIAGYERNREETPKLLEAARKRLQAATSLPAAPPTLTIPAEATLDQLRQWLTDAEADLKAKQEKGKKLDEEAERRSGRLVAIPDEIAEANKRLERIQKELSAPPAVGVVPQVVQARRTLLLAEKHAVEEEIKAYDAELRLYNVRSDLLGVLRDEARRSVAQAQATATAWQNAVARRRQADVDRQKREAEAEVRRAPPAVQAWAEKNARLASERDRLAQKSVEARDRAKRIANTADRVAADFKFLRETVLTRDMVDLAGPILRRQRTDLESLRTYELDLRKIRKELARTRLRHAEIEDERLDLSDLESRTAEVLEALAQTGGPSDWTWIEPRVRQLLEARRDSLELLKKDYEAYTNDLIRLSTAESALLAKADEFGDFIERHVLWIRSAAPLYRTKLPATWTSVTESLGVLGRSLRDDLGRVPWVYAIGGLTVLSLLALRLKWRPKLAALSERVSRAATDSYSATLEALGYTVLLSIPWPVLLVFLGWRVSSSANATEASAYGLAEALGASLRAAAWVLGTLTFARQMCKPEGLARAHFRWSRPGVAVLRTSLRWFTGVAVPATVVVVLTDQYHESVWKDSAGRLCFIGALLALAVLVQRILRPRGGALTERFRRDPAGWLYRLRYVYCGLGLGVPLALAGLSFVGYHFTAVQLTERFIQTLWLFLSLLVLHAMLVRWLFVAQRRLALDRVGKAGGRTRDAGPSQPRAEPPPSEQPVIKLVVIGDQTRKLLRALVVLTALVGVWLAWKDMLPALSFLEDVALWAYSTEVVDTAGAQGVPGAVRQVIQYITLAHVARAVIIGIVTYVLARNIPGLLEIAVLQRLPLDPGGRFAVTAIARYTITVTGVVLAFGSIGLGWSKVQWLVAAMTVGLGFGLQEVFANFICGLIILFERPIRVGDVVTVGHTEGKVSRIRIRATTIRDWDRRELLVPNKEFITGHLINWTLSDPITRVVIRVGIAYGSDISLTKELLYKVARASPVVMDDPPPFVLFRRFGDSALDFELRVYIATRDHWPRLVDGLHTAIDQEFRKAGIEIAFPQVDVHVRTIHQALSVSPAPDRPVGTQSYLDSPHEVP